MARRPIPSVDVQIAGQDVRVSFEGDLDLSAAAIADLVEKVRTHLVDEAESRRKKAEWLMLVKRLNRKAMFSRRGESTCVRKPLWVDAFSGNPEHNAHSILRIGATVTKLADDGETALVEYSLDGIGHTRAGGTACSHGSRFLLPLSTFQSWLQEHAQHSSQRDCREHVCCS